jgi:hypothetical protein
MQAYRTMGIDPAVYLLNKSRAFGTVARAGFDVNQLFSERPGGVTPLTEALQSALADHEREGGGKMGDRPLQLLIISDGEATDMRTFNNILDAIQNKHYGDVQVLEQS